MRIPVLESSRLILRPYEPADFSGFADLNANAEVRRHVGRVLSREEAASLFQRFNNGECTPGNEVWAVILRSTGEYIGHCWLSAAARGDYPQLGFLVSPEFWRQGYGTEIAAAVLDYALKHYTGIEATVDDNHRACIKVLERAGMIRVREEQDADGILYIYSATSMV